MRVEKLRGLVLPHRALGYLVMAAILAAPWVDRSLAAGLALSYVWASLALSYNILLGFAGVASFGHAVPFGVAAFLTAYMLKAGVPYLVVIPVAGIVAGAIYTVMGLPAYRVRGIYYAILTLAIAEALRSTIESTARTTVALTVGSIAELESLAGLYIYLALFLLLVALALASAAQDVKSTRRKRARLIKAVVYAVFLAGLTAAGYRMLFSSAEFLAGVSAGMPRVRVMRFLYPLNAYLLSAVVLAACYIAIKRLAESPLGTTLVAIRENPVRASVLGYNVFAHQLAAFFASGFFGGIAGSVYVASIPTVMTDVFGSDKTFLALTGAIIGGLGTLVGPAVGGIVAGVLRDYLSSLTPALLSVSGLTPQQAQLIPSFVLGVIYIAVVLAMPYGVWGTWLLRGWKLKRKLENLLGFGAS
ncbi:MAG: branched-chain amino acid ABC transporter permease [Thermofilum sp.]